MELGVERIVEWMRSNRLRLNPEKTDFLWCATHCGALIRPSTSVRDLGILLESHLSPLLSLLGWTAATACSPECWRASWTDSSQCSMPPQGSFVTEGSMTTSRRSSVMFSTGCQSHSTSSTSSAYSSFFH